MKFKIIFSKKTLKKQTKKRLQMIAPGETVNSFGVFGFDI